MSYRSKALTKSTWGVAEDQIDANQIADDKIETVNSTAHMLFEQFAKLRMTSTTISLFSSYLHLHSDFGGSKFVMQKNSV